MKSLAARKGDCHLSQDVISIRRLLVVEVRPLSHRYHLGWFSLRHWDRATISRPQTISFTAENLILKSIFPIDIAEPGSINLQAFCEAH